MSSNWSCGWRKLVEWEKERKLYTYRGFDIYPLSLKEQRYLPKHIQNDYYWGEIEIIDNRIKQSEYKTDGRTMDEDLEEFFKELEETV